MANAKRKSRILTAAQRSPIIDIGIVRAAIDALEKQTAAIGASPWTLDQLQEVLRPLLKPGQKPGDPIDWGYWNNRLLTGQGLEATSPEEVNLLPFGTSQRLLAQWDANPPKYEEVLKLSRELQELRMLVERLPVDHSTPSPRAELKKKEWVRVSEAATELNFSESHVRRLMQSGDLVSKELGKGRAKLISFESIVKYRDR